MRRILWNLVYVGLLPFAIWLSGTYEKYPELTIPLFIIWLGIITPQIEAGAPTTIMCMFQRLQKRALKCGDNELIDEIDRVLQYEYDWHTLATVGAVKDALEKYSGYRRPNFYEIQERVEKLIVQKREQKKTGQNEN